MWYRGWTAAALMGVPMAVVQFGAARRFELALAPASPTVDADVTDRTGTDIETETHPPLDPARRAAAAWLAGACSGALVQPLDLAMIQQQKYGGGLAETAARLVRERGVHAWFRGGALTVAREAFYSCGYLWAVPLAREWVRRHHPRVRQTLGDLGEHGLCATMCGVAAAFVTQPLDVVKTVMQSNLGPVPGTRTGSPRTISPPVVSRAATGGEGGARFGGLGYSGTVSALVRDGGVASLWRGMAPRGVRIVGATFILSFVNECAGKAIATWREGT